MKYRTTIVVMTEDEPIGWSLTDFAGAQQRSQGSETKELLLLGQNTECSDFVDYDCVRTFDQDIVKLRCVEAKLAKLLNIEPNDEASVRDQIITMDRNNELSENDLVSELMEEWHSLYCSFVAELKNEFEDYVELHGLKIR